MVVAFDRFGGDAMFSSLPPTAQQLARLQVCSDLSKQDIVGIAGLGTVVDRAPGEVVVWAGDPPREISLVISGELVATNARGSCRLAAGDHFGTTRNAGISVREPATIETLTRVTLFAISRSEFVTLARAYPTFIARLTTPDPVAARASERARSLRSRQSEDNRIAVDRLPARFLQGPC
jgi:CRP-like cAMP-binding protein